jgi:molybdopterin synthase catalytic subunit
MQVIVQTQPFAPEHMLAAFVRGGAAGAMASFVGYCRATSHGHEVERLELECYPALTEREIARLAEAVRLRHDLIDLMVVHRVGEIAVGEAIVLVAALSAHRAPALAAVGELMDYLKSEAPIWKKEVYSGGARWVDPTEQDYRAVKRWRREQEENPHES